MSNKTFFAGARTYLHVHRRGSRAGWLAALALVVSAPSLAAGGRDFAGSYQYTQTADLGDQQQVTLKVRVFNYSGTDVSGATLILENRLQPGSDYGSITGLSIHNGASVPASGSFTIPTIEYQGWQAGAPPALRIGIVNASGDTVRQHIDLGPMPIGVRP